MTLTKPAGLALALSTFLLAGQAQAVNPGCILYTDPAGDVSVLVADPGEPALDILSVGIDDDGENYIFYMQMADLSSLPPQTHWPVRFTGGDGSVYRAYMQTDLSGSPSFHYGISGAPSNVIAVNDAHPDSNYDAGSGLITVIVPASGVGGNKLSLFDTRVVYGWYLPGSGLTPDNAPDDLEPVGSYTLGGTCSSSKTDDLKAGAERNLGSDGRYFSAGAGSLGGLALLVLGALGWRRRRA